jgi:hypothetical protein
MLGNHPIERRFAHPLTPCHDGIPPFCRKRTPRPASPHPAMVGGQTARQLQSLREHSGTLAQPSGLGLDARPGANDTSAMTLHVPRLPFALDPLIAEAKRRARQRRYLLTLSALILVALATGLTLGFRSSGGGSGSGVPTTGASVRVGALRFTVPRGFYRRQIRRNGKLIGTLVTDYRVTADSPTLRQSVFPANAVLLSLGRGAPSWLPLRSLPPLRLPLTLGRLGGPKLHPGGTTWNSLFRFRGQLYAITFWAGHNTQSNDRAALKQALLSIHASH